eukprot:7899936-Alexandrium_andersonii.AAC.1
MCIRDSFRRSNLELLGPKSRLRIGARSSRGVRSAQFGAHIPNWCPKLPKGSEIATSPTRRLQ